METQRLEIAENNLGTTKTKDVSLHYSNLEQISMQ